MTTEFNDIHAALDSHLSTFATANSLPVAWPNIPFTEQSNEEYLRPTVLLAETVQACLGDSGKDLYNGTYQVDLFQKRGCGRSATPDLIATHFKRGSVLTFNGLFIRVVSASLNSTFTDDNFLISPVSIRFQVFTPPR